VVTQLVIFCRATNGSWEVCNGSDPDAVAFRPVANISVPDLLNVLTFLCWCEDDDATALWGGVRVQQAIESMQTLLSMPDQVFEDLKNIALVQFDKVKTTKVLDEPNSSSN
jgi:hypothetical protein